MIKIDKQHSLIIPSIFNFFMCLLSTHSSPYHFSPTLNPSLITFSLSYFSPTLSLTHNESLSPLSSTFGLPLHYDLPFPSATDLSPLWPHLPFAPHPQVDLVSRVIDLAKIAQISEVASPLDTKSLSHDERPWPWRW